MSDLLSEPQRWVIPAVLVVSAVGAGISTWWEKRHPTSYTRRPDVMGAWAAMTAGEQEAYDTAVLNRVEQAELYARVDAEEAARAAVEDAARRNVLYHP